MTDLQPFYANNQSQHHQPKLGQGCTFKINEPFSCTKFHFNWSMHLHFRSKMLSVHNDDDEQIKMKFLLAHISDCLAGFVSNLVCRFSYLRSTLAENV